MMLILRLSLSVYFDFLWCQLLIDHNFMAQWALKRRFVVNESSSLISVALIDRYRRAAYLILNVKPLSKTHSVEVVFAPGDFSRWHFLIADCTNVVKVLELGRWSFRQRWNLLHRRSSLNVNWPTSFSFAPNVKVAETQNHSTNEHKKKKVGLTCAQLASRL